MNHRLKYLAREKLPPNSDLVLVQDRCGELCIGRYFHRPDMRIAGWHLRQYWIVQPYHTTAFRIGTDFILSWQPIFAQKLYCVACEWVGDYEEAMWTPKAQCPVCETELEVTE